MALPNPSSENPVPSLSVLSKPAARPTGFRIEYLDGIRGLAALAVAIMHAFEIFGLGAHPVGVFSDGLLDNGLFDRAFTLFYSHFFQRANYAVEIFIVLSGYSLMLGVARSKDGHPKGGLKGYFKRRIRRIWPPYYAALGISLAVILLVPGMNQKHNLWWDLALPALTPEAILSHIFFAQSVHPDWLFKINPPMWTISVEEQIYILFPLLLLPFWRRFGTRAMVAVALVAGIGATFVLRPYFANIWYLGLFALGAAAASVGFSSRSGEEAWRQRIPWGKIGLGVFAFFVVLSEVNNRVDFGIGDPFWIIDTVLGVAVACMLVALTERWKQGEDGRGLPLRLFEHPLVVSLGRFSYSLYLMHAPILALVALMVYQSGLRSAAAYGIIFGAGVPLAVAGTYLFHRVFERPFMPPSAVASAPAPVAAEPSAAA